MKFGILQAGIAALWGIHAFSVAGAQDMSDPVRAGETAIAEIAGLISENYYDAAGGEHIARDMIRFAGREEIASLGAGDELAAALTAHLQEQDRHFDVRWRGVEEIALTRAEWAALDAAEAQPQSPDIDRWASLRRRNFAFADVSVLDGNIGYINLTGFAPLEPAEATARAALDFVAYTDAIIIDLRENGGGAPEMVQYVLSHFLPGGENRLYNTFRSRNGDVQEMHTLSDHPAGHRPHVPLYVLVSPDSLSAAEALAYHLQAMGRAVIVGEVTAGGGNPGEIFLADSGYSIFIPTATSISPFTGTNWDGTGVQPDLMIEAGNAFDRALMEIYARIAETAEDPGTAMLAAWQLAPLQARFTPWTPGPDELEAFVGTYGPRRIWLENGTLMYQREGRPENSLLPMTPGTFRFADSEDYLIDFLNYSEGQAEAMMIRVEAGATPPTPRS
ncbi:S41 family peptidase [Maricaulis parjimensis]|uniref:S41 family peptidase n=1 Tax=Maricaulis parjimensis TaxID=144023 RepID=UPI00193AB5D7|nr:S41 family peptidase [Maricaulis parjimensis]